MDSMDLNVNVRFLLGGPALAAVTTALQLANERLEAIMATQTELAQSLLDLAAKADKVKAEVIAKLAELEAAIAAAGNTTPEVDAALAGLQAALQGADDAIPDAPPPAP